MLKILFFFCHFINITKLWFNGALRPLSYNKSTKLSCQCCSLSSIHHSSLCYCEPKFFRIFFVNNAFLEIIIIETFPRKNVQFSVHKPDSRVMIVAPKIFPERFRRFTIYKNCQTNQLYATITICFAPILYFDCEHFLFLHIV